MNTKKYGLLLCSFFFFLSSFAFAQTAREMDAMLASDTVSAAAAARFVLGAADLLPPGLSGQGAERTAYNMAESNGWVNASADDEITMKDAAFLIMKAFDLKGGAMYTLLKNPRYAYREMVYRKLIRGRMDQAVKVSGPELLLILDKTMKHTEQKGGH